MHLFKKYPPHGWLGVILVTVFWYLNWSMFGLRTHYGFFPLWLGYILVMDGLAWMRKGDSPLTRDRENFREMFLLSIPVWWLFELIDMRTAYWIYEGRENFSDFQYFILASLSFSTVIPAVFCTSEFLGTFKIWKKIPDGPKWGKNKRDFTLIFILGWIMLALVLLWPQYFTPFLWISLFFICDPVNKWMGNKSLISQSGRGDWQLLILLAAGSLVCGFFWEMWNIYSYPKWLYDVPYLNFWHVFEMPLLGYLGYIPFAWELYAIYHLLKGLMGRKNEGYLQFLK